MSHLEAVQKRTKAFKSLQDSFANRIVKHFKLLIVELARERPEVKGSSLNMKSHVERHDELLLLAPLVHWLHDADPVSRYLRLSFSMFTLGQVLPILRHLSGSSMDGNRITHCHSDVS